MVTVGNGLAAAGRRNATLGLFVAGFAAIGCGLWISLHYALGAWKPDPDIFVTVELWRGFEHYGWSFFPSWAYTQDNWLLSLIPVTSALFKLFGTRAETAMIVGWLSFAASTGLAAWLAWRLAGARAALALACVLVFADLEALGRAGYLGYPISHDISMTWGLLALVLAVLALDRGGFGLALLAAAAVFVDAVSDPWAGVGIAAPLIVASAAIALLNRRTRLGACAAVLSVAVAVALWAARTRLFGMLGFLPKSQLHMADLPTMLVNMYWAYRSLGAIFNIVPGAGLDSHIGRLVSVAALIAVLGSAMVLTAVALRRAPPVRQLITGVALLSILGVAGLYVIGRWDQNIAVGRFFPNVYFLGGLLVAVVAAEGWARWSSAERAGLSAYAALFVISGVLSAPGLWTGAAGAADPSKDEAVELGTFLNAHQLSYGYGPFWGAHALVMNTATEERVTIRPVTFRDGRVRRRPAETSSLWYRAGAEPAANRPFVLVRNDGEECSQPDACVAAAIRQFGEPIERLTWRNSVVLVWPHEIAGAIDP